MGPRRFRRALVVAAVAGAFALAWGTGVAAPLPGATRLLDVRAATPSGSPAAGGDTRSAGEGPGVVGSPVLAVLGVLVVGFGTAALTILSLRLTGDRRDRRGDAPGHRGASTTDTPDSG